MGFYFRYVYEFLFARRYVTARILAEESLERQGVVFPVTTVCLLLRTVIVVQKENLARTEKRCLQMLKQLFVNFLAVQSREEIGVRSAVETTFMVSQYDNVYQPLLSSPIVNSG